MKQKYIILLLLLPLLIFASGQKQSKEESLNLLLGSKALYAEDIFDINSTISRSNFKNFNRENFLLHSSKKNFWVALNIDTSGLKEPILYVDSPHLTKFNIYDIHGKLLQTLGYGKRKESTLFPYYELKSNKKSMLYLQMQSHYLPLIAEVKLGEKERFLNRDTKKKFYNILLLGSLLMGVILLLVQLYLDRKREILYLIMLIFLLSYYQLSYSGLAFIIASNAYALLDIAITSVKLNLITIALVLYSVTLLKISKGTLKFQLFKGILFIALLELFLAGFMNLRFLYVLIPLVFALLLGIFLLFRAFIEEKREYIFPLIGYVALLISFGLQLLTALGVVISITIQESIPLILTLAQLAIAGKYLYSYIAKEQNDCNNLIEGLDRKYILESMLQNKKEELAALNKAKEILKHDIHTIIDNNFKQILLALQSGESTIDYSKLTKQLANIEQRMQAISICYTHMLENRNLTTIDMKHVIEEIIEQIQTLYADENCSIEVVTDIDATLAINDAVIAATTISEIVMDTFKNSCHKEEGLILSISLQQYQESYKLNVKDYQKGTQWKSEAKSTLQKLKERLQQLQFMRSLRVDS